MRKNGVLMHITSLPSKYGIGTMGKSAYDFVDFLKDAGQSYWQILPIQPTSYGDSPYASPSTFATNPYLIDLDLLAQDGLLEKKDYENLDWGDKPEAVDFEKIYNNRFKVLHKAAKKFLEKPDKDYEAFKKDNADWLDDYALFRAIKDANEGKPWMEWEEEEKIYDPKKAEKLAEKYAEQVEFYKVLQYLFKKQWEDLKKYANDNGIEIIGDMPIYVALDSADVWSHPELFQLDERRVPKSVAGVPPDGFSADGQLWGNPVYDWKKHKEQDYEWWAKRIGYLSDLYNVLRIDHFRGFDSYYAIPYGDKTARNGHWEEGPGIELFEAVKDKIGDREIIAEDLGYLTPSVKKLLADSGFPGMKILEFAFDSRDAASSEYLPFKYPTNSIAYPGTHDNETLAGWIDSIEPEEREFAMEFINAKDKKDVPWAMIKAVMASPADTAIIAAQDLLGLDNSARMNQPNTLGGNWVWRAKPGEMDEALAKKMNNLTKVFKRYPGQNEVKEPEKEEEKGEKSKEEAKSTSEKKSIKSAKAADKSAAA